MIFKHGDLIKFKDKSREFNWGDVIFEVVQDSQGLWLKCIVPNKNCKKGMQGALINHDNFENAETYLNQQKIKKILKVTSG